MADDLTSLVRVLKDGFWEQTAIHALPNGQQILRKASKPAAARQPWAQETLRREIAYLASVPAEARPYFPPLLRSWDDPATGRLGYEIPYYADWMDAARRLQAGVFTGQEAGQLQEALANVIFQKLHQPVLGAPSLASHVVATIGSVTAQLAEHSDFAALVASPRVAINGQEFLGLAASASILAGCAWPAALDAIAVRLHGDLILENILCPPRDETEPAIRLIDPVSVAGIAAGHPLFDLVKYQSYATGELYAFRAELLDTDATHLRVWWEDAALQPFRRFDLATIFRQGYEQKHGPVDQQLSALLESYFALVMAVNTTGKQQWARVLKGLMSLHQATAG